MMTQDWEESTKETINFGTFLNQFSPVTIKQMRLLEKINKIYVDKKWL